MKKIIIIYFFIASICTVKAQVLQLDTVLFTSYCGEVIVKDSVRIKGSQTTIGIQSFYADSFIGGSGYSRYHYCLHNNSRFYDLEALPNGNFAGLFLYNESCRPLAVVVLVVDSVGNFVSEYYYENNVRGKGEIIVTDSVFHVYTQFPMGGNYLDTRHLVFDLNGNRLDSTGFVTQRSYFGVRSFRGDKIILYGEDSLLVSYYDGALNWDLKQGIFDLELSNNYRELQTEAGYLFGEPKLQDSIVAMISTSKVDGELVGGMCKVNTLDGSLKRNLRRGIYVYDFIPIAKDYYVLSTYDGRVWSEKNELVIYDSELREVYRKDAPIYGRLLALSDSSFIMYDVELHSGNSYIYQVDVETLKTLEPLLEIGPKEELMLAPTTNDSISDTLVSSEYTKVTEGVYVYPNPASSQCILASEQALNGEVRLYSSTGTLVLTEQVNGRVNPLDVSGLSDGMYILRYTGKNNTFTQRITVSH